jgi:hypothetical protein
MTDWAAAWSAFRFNHNHKGPGAGGGEFTSSGGAGSGSKAPKAGGHGKAPAHAAQPASRPPATGQGEQKRRLIAQANQDRAKAAVLRQQLHAIELQLKSRSATAKTAAAAKSAKSTAATAKKSNVATAKKSSVASTSTVSLQNRAAALRTQIHALMANARQLDARAAHL